MISGLKDLPYTAKLKEVNLFTGSLYKRRLKADFTGVCKFLHGSFPTVQDSFNLAQGSAACSLQARSHLAVGALPVLCHSWLAGRSGRGGLVLKLTHLRSEPSHSSPPPENISNP